MINPNTLDANPQAQCCCRFLAAAFAVLAEMAGRGGEGYLVSWLGATEFSRYLLLKMSFSEVRQEGVRPPTAPYVGYRYPEET